MHQGLTNTADDGGGIDGVLAVRDGGEVKDGIRVEQRVITVTLDGRRYGERFAT